MQGKNEISRNIKNNFGIVKNSDGTLYTGFLSQDIRVNLKTRIRLIDSNSEVSRGHLVRQGGTGDCYILAVILGIIEKEPRAFNQMFHATNSSLTINFNRANLNELKNINQEQFTNKLQNKGYKISILPDGSFSVTINKEKFDSIRNNQNGIQQGGLYIAALEHFISHVIAEIDGQDLALEQSLIFHEQRKSHGIDVLSNLFGYDLFPSKSAGDAINLLERFEGNNKSFLYVTLQWGAFVNGMYHGVHAIKFDFYDPYTGIFYFQNPWDSSKTCEFKKDELLQRNIVVYELSKKADVLLEYTNGVPTRSNKTGRYDLDGQEKYFFNGLEIKFTKNIGSGWIPIEYAAIEVAQVMDDLRLANEYKLKLVQEIFPGWCANQSFDSSKKEFLSLFKGSSKSVWSARNKDNFNLQMQLLNSETKTIQALIKIGQIPFKSGDPLVDVDVYKKDIERLHELKIFSATQVTLSLIEDKMNKIQTLHDNVLRDEIQKTMGNLNFEIFKYRGRAEEHKNQLKQHIGVLCDKLIVKHAQEKEYLLNHIQQLYDMAASKLINIKLISFPVGNNPNSMFANQMSQEEKVEAQHLGNSPVNG